MATSFITASKTEKEEEIENTVLLKISFTADY